MSDYYHDDPVEFSKPKSKKFPGLFALLIFIFAGGNFLQTTLAANISLGSGGRVEYGQGVAITAACAGSTALTVTPKSSFVNASGSGNFKFTSITVSNIPASCATKQFNFSAYDVNGTQAALFNGKTSLVVAGDGTTINTKWDVTGVSVKGSYDAQGIGTFTATFTTTPAAADSVTTFALQSADAEFKPKYSVGDKGPAGGTVYYADYAGFSSPGAPCATSCNYLEYAPKNWSGSTDDPSYIWSSNTSTYGVDIRNSVIYESGQWLGNGALGAGFMNTKNMLTSNAATGYTADTSGAAYRASQYAGPTGSSLGQWHLPSYRELYFMFAYGQGVPAGLIGASPQVESRYWSSSELSTSEAASMRVEYGSQGQRPKNQQLWVRPVRVF